MRRASLKLLNIFVPLENNLRKTLEKLKNPDLNDSKFVMENFGVGGVCEPSSIALAGEGSFNIRKISYNGVNSGYFSIRKLFSN